MGVENRSVRVDSPEISRSLWKVNQKEEIRPENREVYPGRERERENSSRRATEDGAKKKESIR